jgi:hypothetical protein
MTPGTAAAKRQQEFQNERRVKSRRRDKRPFSMAALRCKELNRLFTYRYGRVLPDDDAGWDDARIMVHHLGKLTRDTDWRINNWLDLRAPRMTDGDRAKLLAEVQDKPRRWSAAKLGLTDAERRHLKITTIGAIDVPKAERAKRRKELDRKAKVEQRRAAGVRPRAEFLAKSLCNTKPWVALGMSRASWYRAGKPTQ